MKKVCSICQKEKDVMNFRKRKDKRCNSEYYNSMCKDCEKQYIKKYKLENKEQLKEKNKIYNTTHKEEMKKWYKNNKEYRKKYNNLYFKNRKQKDKIFKLKCQMRIFINTCFTRKQLKKERETEKILGCDVNTFYNHLIKTFYENYGYEWDGIEAVHIDHIIPLDCATTEREIIGLCNYKNLQLLKPIDNLKKSNKLNWQLEKEEKNYEFNKRR